MGSYFQKLSINIKIRVLIIVLLAFSIINIVFLWKVHNENVPTFSNQNLIYEVQHDLTNLKGMLRVVKIDSGFDFNLVKNQINTLESKISLLSRNGEYKGERTYALEGTAGRTLKDLEVLWYPYKSHLNRIVSVPRMVDTLVWRNAYMPLADTSIVLAEQAVKKVITIPNPRFENSLGSAIINMEGLLLKINELSFDYGYQQRNSVDITVYVLGLGVTAIVFFVVLYYFLNQAFIKPLLIVSGMAERVNKNKVIEDPILNENYETGKISRALVQLSAGLKNASNYAQELFAGNLEVQIEGLEEGKEIKKKSLFGALFNLRRKLQEVEIKEKRENWVNEGVSKFVDVLRQDFKTLDEFGDTILASLVPYMDSQMGALYTLEGSSEFGENQVLKMRGKYAYGTKKFESDEVVLGEGIVGQVFLEQKTVHLTEIPESFTSIKASFGEQKPTALLIFPLILNETVFGVIELGSFRSFENFEIEFVNRLSELLASSINAVKSGAKTKSLLEESQQMAEQMKAQEEEMRQNMEELSATQEEMGRKEVELSSQIAAFRGLPFIEFDAQLTCLSWSDAFLRKTGVTPAKLNHMNIQDLLLNVTPPVELNHVVRTNKVTEIQFTLPGNNKTLEGSIVPVLNTGNNEFIKVMLVLGQQTTLDSIGDNKGALNRLEKELKAAKIAHNALLENKSASFGIVASILDPASEKLPKLSVLEHRIIAVNDAFCSKFGYIKENVSEHAVKDILIENYSIDSSGIFDSKIIDNTTGEQKNIKIAVKETDGERGVHWEIFVIAEE